MDGGSPPSVCPRDRPCWDRMACPASMQRTGTGNRRRLLRHQKVGHSENCEVRCHQKTLVGGLEHFFSFQILGIIIPSDELILFRGVETTSQNMSDTFLYLLWGLCKRKRSSKPSTQAGVNRILNESNKILVEQFVL